MRFYFTIIHHLTIAAMVCLPDVSWCYGTQDQAVENKESEVMIVTQYNNATRISRSVLHSIPLPISETAGFNHLYVNAAADYQGRKPTTPETIKIGFGSRPCHLSDESEPEVTIWADRILIYSGKLQLLVCSGGIQRESEFGTIDVSFNDFLGIAGAIKVEVKIGGHQFELSDDARRGFRRLIHFLNGY